MKILFFTDCFGGDISNDKDFKYLKQAFEDKGVKADFVMTTSPMDITLGNYDILAFDYGGIGFGSTGMAHSISKLIIRALEDFPNKLFIVWTSCTNEYLKSDCKKELGSFYNLLVREDLGDDKDLMDNVKKYCKERNGN